MNYHYRLKESLFIPVTPPISPIISHSTKIRLFPIKSNIFPRNLPPPQRVPNLNVAVVDYYFFRAQLYQGKHDLNEWKIIREVISKLPSKVFSSADFVSNVDEIMRQISPSGYSEIAGSFFLWMVKNRKKMGKILDMKILESLNEKNWVVALKQFLSAEEIRKTTICCNHDGIVRFYLTELKKQFQFDIVYMLFGIFESKQQYLFWEFIKYYYLEFDV